MNIKEIHSVIREDIITNQKDLLNREFYYTHKYRSQDRLIDINVGIFLNEDYKPTVQIYVADNNTKIRERFFLNNASEIITNEIIIKEYE